MPMATALIVSRRAEPGDAGCLWGMGADEGCGSSRESEMDSGGIGTETEDIGTETVLWVATMRRGL